MSLKPHECPRFNRCNAALCPLDSDWRIRSMMREDTVCFYLSEASKEGAEARFKGVSDKRIYLQARESLPEMTASSNILKNRLKRAAQSGSRLDAIKRFASLKAQRLDSASELPVLRQKAA